MLKNKHLILSQSETKELGVYVIDDQVEEIDFCPKRYYHKYIAEDYPRSPTPSMLKGLYFETLLLGSSAHGEKTTDLPRKKNGDKTAVQERIERQVHRLYGYMYAHGVRIRKNNVQLKLIAEYKPHVWLRGEFDIFPAIVDDKISIVDVKSTKDVYSTFFSIEEKWVRGSSNSCWGDFKRIVKNQPLFYHYIIRNFNKLPLSVLKRFNPEQYERYEGLYDQTYDDVTFNFFVAGIGKEDIDDQLVRHEYEFNQARVILLDALIDAAIRRVKDAVNTQFEARPSNALCASCALKDLCTKANK